MVEASFVLIGHWVARDVKQVDYDGCDLGGSVTLWQTQNSTGWGDVHKAALDPETFPLEVSGSPLGRLPNTLKTVCGSVGEEGDLLDLKQGGQLVAWDCWLLSCFARSTSRRYET